MHILAILLPSLRRLSKPRYETNLVFIHIKIEQYVINHADSDYFTIHFCIKLSRLSFLDQRINKKHTSKIYFF